MLNQLIDELQTIQQNANLQKAAQQRQKTFQKEDILGRALAAVPWFAVDNKDECLAHLNIGMGLAFAAEDRKAVQWLSECIGYVGSVMADATKMDFDSDDTLTAFTDWLDEENGHSIAAGYAQALVDGQHITNSQFREMYEDQFEYTFNEKIEEKTTEKIDEIKDEIDSLFYNF